MSEMRCENCRWWGAERAQDDDYPLGRCRAGKPSPLRHMMLPTPEGKYGTEGSPIIRGDWVWVAFDDWCADYEPACATSRTAVRFAST